VDQSGFSFTVKQPVRIKAEATRIKPDVETAP